MCTGARPNILFPDTARAEWVGLWNGQIVENVFHIDTGGVNTAAGLDAIADVLKTWLGDQWVFAASSGVAMQTIKVKSLHDDPGAYHEETISPNIVGDVGGATMPNNVTVAVRWNTGLGGRSYRGRTFHLGMPTSFVTGASLTTTGHTTLQNVYTTFLNRLLAMSPARQLVVASYCNGGDWRTTGVATPVINCTIDVALDSMRRRLIGRGS